MNYEAAKFWMEVLMFAINAVVWIYVWRVRRDMATNQKITDIEETISDHIAENGVQLAQMDGRLKGAVGHADIKGIYARLTGIDKGLAKLEGRFESLDHLNVAIQEIALGGRK